MQFMNRWGKKLYGESTFIADPVFEDERLCPLYITWKGYTFIPLGFEIARGYGRPEEKEVHLVILNFDFRWSCK